jgi:trimeric autotransporter adhesin
MRKTSFSFSKQNSQEPNYRGGEKKVMKKSLSSILAASMVASMFASVAFAAETPKTAQEMFDVLKTKGVFEGINDAGDAGLDKEMNRAQVSKILVKLMGLTEDAAGAAGYKDLTVETWAKGFIGAATKAKLMEGTAPEAFDPAGTFTTEQLATVMVRALGLTVETGATVKGDVSDWATGYVAAAVKAGLIAESADYTAPALREVLVTTSFAAYTKIEEAKAPIQKVEVKAVGIKKMEVTFAAAVDTTKVTFAVKKGTQPANVAKYSFNDAKTVATLEMASNLVKGDYEVTVGGVVTPEFKQTLTLEDEKVAKIEFTSDKAPYDRTNGDNTNKVLTSIKVLNQYGENRVESYAGDLTLSAGKGGFDAGDGKGNYVITAPTGASFNLNEVVPVTAVHKSGTFASANLTVSPKAAVAEVAIEKLNKKDDKTLNVDADPANFWLVATFKDQYGNKVKAADAKGDVIITNTNPAVADLSTFKDDGDKVFITLDKPLNAATPDTTDRLAKYGKGKTSFQILSKTTAKSAAIEVEVVDVAKVDAFTLTAPDLVVAGEKVEIPFTAVDQFGKDLTKASDIAAGFTTAPNGSVNGTALTAAQLAFEQDWVANKAKLVLDLSSFTGITEKTTAFISAITATNKVVTLNLTVNPVAKPEVITNVENVTAAVAIGAETTFKAEHIKVLDQYGRTKKFSDFSTVTYNVYATTDETKAPFIEASAEAKNIVINHNNSNVLKGKADASINVTLKVRKGTEDVKGSEYTFALKVVKLDAVTNYEVADIAKLYAGGSVYTKDFKVTGLLADGSKVTVPASAYSVTADTYLNFGTAGKIYAETGTPVGGTDKEKTYKVIVVGQTKDQGVTIIKDVVVSNVAPVVTALSLETKEVKDGAGTVLYKVAKESDGVASITLAHINTISKEQLAAAIVKAVDQFGYTYSTADKISNVVIVPTDKAPAKDANFSTLATALKAGDSFNVTAVSKDNLSISFKVIVK